MTIGLIDYGMGNQGSVRNALLAVGADVLVVREARDLESVHGVVLPGVGAFGAGMRRLHDLDLVAPLRAHVVDRELPFLGICLGMQLLASIGTEFGETRGLDWIDGTVRRLTPPPELRIPHIGWNAVDGTGPLFAGIPAQSAFYFVHSYCFDVTREQAVVGRTHYGEHFVSAVQFNHLFGVQFHPEKSHTHGLMLLRNFTQLAHA
jgi:imidazole glycerol-phosphate synthase subunit HisH